MAKPHGQIRRSQIITTFGPGALLDLPNYSVIVGGLDNWSGEQREVHENRLLDKLKSILEVADLQLLEPPKDRDDDFTPSSGVTVWQFPEWFVTQDVDKKGGSQTRSRYLVHKTSLNKNKFEDLDRNKYSVVPIRFVRACREGHIGDINWPKFVHGDVDCKRQLYMEERGTSGDLSEIFIKCECGKAQSLLEASKMDQHTIGPCDGHRPWLGNWAKEKCGEPNRLLIRNASNAYFPQVMNVISIPENEDPISGDLDKVWNDVKEVESLNDLTQLFKFNKTAKEKLSAYLPEKIVAAIEEKKNKTSNRSYKPVKQAELETLLLSTDEIGEDKPDGDFFARNLPRKKWDRPWMESIDRVVLVHRLREVTAQVGFTRFEAAAPDISGELDLDIKVKRADLARELKWLPAVENRGEGIFLSFSKDAIDKWVQKPEVIARSKILEDGFYKWADEAKSKREFPGLPYYLLHSISHLLITAVSLDCGYPASSIRERVYAEENSQGYGILLFTGSPDAEGTLGGLIEVGRNIHKHLKSALEMAELCSNDPVCAHHSPPNPHEKRYLLGAACHSCLLIAETSCEMQNNYLDRALVIPTVENLGAEFFRL